MAAGDSLGMHAYGTTIWHAPDDTANPEGANPPTGFTQIAEVISLNGLAAQRTVVELTHLSSPAFAKEKIPGFEDGGQVVFRFNYSMAVFAALSALMPAANRTSPSWGRLQWVVQLADGGQWYFRGFLQGHPFTVPEDDRITIEATIEISGAPIFVEGA